MKQIGFEGHNDDENGDFVSEVIVELDYFLVKPLLSRKPIKTFSICTNSFNELMKLLKKEVTNSKYSALILMRVPEKYATTEDVKDFGWEISEKIFSEGLVVWCAKKYDVFKFDFYIYTSNEDV